jgi:hypothetical protein
MYSGFGATVTGWRRNFAAILGGDRMRTAAVCATLLAPVAALFALVSATATGAGAIPGVAAYVLGTAASWANRASGGQRWITALLWPAECILTAATILLAGRDRRRGRLTAWKGRTIEL